MIILFEVILNDLFVIIILIFIFFVSEYFEKWGVSVVFNRKFCKFIINVVRIMVDIGLFVVNNVYIMNWVLFVKINFDMNIIFIMFKCDVIFMILRVKFILM